MVVNVFQRLVKLAFFSGSVQAAGKRLNGLPRELTETCKLRPLVDYVFRRLKVCLER